MVIGASPNPARYSYKAVIELKNNGHPIVPLGIKKGDIDGVEIENGLPAHKNIDTISLYIGPFVQNGYKDYIINLKPRRIIFNPGTENLEMFDLCEQNNIEAVEACTLIMLAGNKY